MGVQNGLPESPGEGCMEGPASGLHLYLMELWASEVPGGEPQRGLAWEARDQTPLPPWAPGSPWLPSSSPTSQVLAGRFQAGQDHQELCSEGWHAP